MLRVAIVGASGYTGGELARLLSAHPEVEITAATSRQYEGIPLGRVFPNLFGHTPLICRNLSVDEILEASDFIFCAVPHKTAMAIVPQFLAAGKKVVDLSADFRLHDVATYEKWYQKHTAPELLAEAVYGLPEVYSEQIGNAHLVANPGCYPTSITLALAPLLKNGDLDTSSIIADSKSGASGAGRTAAVGTLFCEVNEGFKPYKIGGTHRHVPEIEQNISALAGEELTLSFTPHLLPISRGILSTVYANLRVPAKEADLHHLYKTSYEQCPFVRVLDENQLPATQYVRGSNFCDLGISVDARTNRVILTSAIDNLVKGASGQAVQNMNLMCGFEETAGLKQLPLFP